MAPATRTRRPRNTAASDATTVPSSDAADTTAEQPADQPADAEQPVADENGVLRPDVAATVRKLKSVRAESKGLKGEDEQLVADLRAANLAPGDYYDGDIKVLTVSRGTSFSTDRAAEVIPEALLPSISRRVPDPAKIATALADGVISDEVYQAITTAQIDAALAEDNLPPKLFRACKVTAANPTLKPA